MISATVETNFTPGANPNYPKYHSFPIQEKKGFTCVDYPAQILSRLVGADCWGVCVKRPNGSITPIINTYALFDEIGQSFGLNCKPTPQYEHESEVRDKIISDPASFLNQLRPHESLWVYLGGSIFRYAVFTKTGDGLSWKYNDYYHEIFKPFPKL